MNTTEPRLVEAAKGWLAIGERWAVSAPTREDALRKFDEQRKLRAEIDARPEPPRVVRDENG